MSGGYGGGAPLRFGKAVPSDQCAGLWIRPVRFKKSAGCGGCAARLLCAALSGGGTLPSLWQADGVDHHCRPEPVSAETAERGKTEDLSEDEWECTADPQTGMEADDRLLLTQCMTQLSDEERQIVVLHAAAGFRHREIADMLGLPLPTVLSKYHRTLKKLRTFLEKGDGSCDRTEK